MRSDFKGDDLGRHSILSMCLGGDDPELLFFANCDLWPIAPRSFRGTLTTAPALTPKD